MSLRGSCRRSRLPFERLARHFPYKNIALILRRFRQSRSPISGARPPSPPRVGARPRRRRLCNAAREGVVVTRDELLETVWGYDAPQTTRTLDNHIATLRAKLEPDPANPRYLHTVHGVGYRLVLNRL